MERQKGQGHGSKDRKVKVMPERFNKRIMRLMTRSDYQPVKKRVLAHSLHVADEDYDKFKEAIEQLHSDGSLVIGAKGCISLPEMANRVVGIYQANSKGFGFIRPDRATVQGDLYIPSGESLDAVTGDKVVARVFKGGKRDGQMRCRGRIVEVLSRGETQFVGMLKRQGREWFVQPDGKAVTEVISVDDPSAKDAKVGDKVLVEILSYPNQEYYACGVIVERLGKSGTSDAELKGIMRRFKLEDKFSKSALNETRQATHSFDAEEEIKAGGREDIRGQNIITIDPADARDFDDAISVRRLANNHWQLAVHIADVSCFVKPQTHLEEEAQQRGNSVYLPGHVIPMLPELLSNGICSLQEGQDRFVKSVYVKLDAKGEVLGTRFANSVMRSSRRLTYEEVDRVLDGEAAGLDKKTLGLIKKMEEEKYQRSFILKHMKNY